MKLAAIYNGFSRNILDVIENHKKTIFNNLEHDIFFFFWPNDENGNEINKEKIIDVLQPKAYEFGVMSDDDRTKLNNLIDLLDKRRYEKVHIQENRPDRITYSSYTLQKAFNVFDNYYNTVDKKYDLVLRVRPDCKFDEDKAVNYYVDDFIHTYIKYIYGTPPMCDQFVYGNYYNMKKFFNVIDDIPKYKSVHMESLFGEHMEANNINKKFDWENHFVLIK